MTKTYCKKHQFSYSVDCLHCQSEALNELQNETLSKIFSRLDKISNAYNLQDQLKTIQKDFTLEVYRIVSGQKIYAGRRKRQPTKIS